MFKITTTVLCLLLWAATTRANPPCESYYGGVSMYVVPQLLSQCTSIGIPSELCNDGYPDALGSTIAEFISLCEGNNINFVDCGDMQGFTGGLCRDGNTACTSDAFTTTVIDSTGSEVTTQHFGADPGLCATLQADCLSIVGNFESLSQQVGGCPYFGVNYVNGVPSTPVLLI